MEQGGEGKEVEKLWRRDKLCQALHHLFCHDEINKVLGNEYLRQKHEALECSFHRAGACLVTDFLSLGGQRDKIRQREHHTGISQLENILTSSSLSDSNESLEP